MAYYISFLKTLSLKLNNHTVHFFYNEVSNCHVAHLRGELAGQSPIFFPGGLLSVYKALMCSLFPDFHSNTLALACLKFF